MTSRLFSSAIGASFLAFCATATPLCALADDHEAAFEPFDISFNFRYRAEAVDQDGFSKDALASTLRSRLTVEGAAATGWSWVAEVDDVRSIGPEDYNSTTNGETRYPVVADPEGTDINRASLAWQQGGFTLRTGRLRIGHGTERFIGGVAWRQNEQTYDGARALWEPSEAFSLDASYVASVRRIFGPDDGVQPSNWDGDSFFLHGVLQPTKSLELRSFAYRLDVEADKDFGSALTVDNSTDTLGLEADWVFGALAVRGAFARQWDYGQSTLDFAADYHMVEGEFDLGGVDLAIAREVLGADNGVGFRTPLATLHKFQGWADVFLATPARGVEDTSVTLKGGSQRLSWRVVAHRFVAERGDRNYGNELDLDLRWRVSQRVTLQLRYARFDASDSVDSAFRDVQKAWFIAQVALP